VLKRSWAGEVRNISLLVAIGVNAEGYREILGICEGAKVRGFSTSNCAAICEMTD
jgi:transposase-like protein